jgi:hypothetical protein
MAFLGMVGSAISKSFGSLLACRIVVAGAGAATEALGAAIVNVSMAPMPGGIMESENNLI